MASLIEFDAWLQTLPALGYDRDWIRRNEAALRSRFATDTSPMPPCPQPTVRVKDRYEEL